MEYNLKGYQFVGPEKRNQPNCCTLLNSHKDGAFIRLPDTLLLNFGPSVKFSAQELVNYPQIESDDISRESFPKKKRKF
jgi:hypothetical protein